MKYFFPKIIQNSNNVEIFYHADLSENDFGENDKITKIFMSTQSGQIRIVVLPCSLEVFEKWYKLHIASTLYHLTISYSVPHEIYWDSLPYTDSDSIKFDILKELEKRNFDDIIVEGNNKMRFIYVS
jgi:hypothetical protein